MNNCPSTVIKLLIKVRGDGDLDNNIILTYLACIIILFLFGRIFILPLKMIIKLIFNSVLGAICLFLINMIGTMWGFHIGINIGTTATIGFLGLPGVILLILLKLLIGG